MKQVQKERQEEGGTHDLLPELFVVPVGPIPVLLAKNVVDVWVTTPPRVLLKELVKEVVSLEVVEVVEVVLLVVEELELVELLEEVEDELLDDELELDMVVDED